MAEQTDRRCFLARGVIGAAGIGAAALSSIEEQTLQAATQDGPAPANPSATPKTDIPPGSLPCGKIGNVSISRLLIGGNLIGGWAHSRDLMYVSKLFKAYNTEAKFFETLELAQACGVNMIQLDYAWETILKYNEHRTTKLQVMANPPLLADKTKMNDAIKHLVDKGVALMYPHGGATDAHFMNGGKIDVLAQAVELIKAQGVPAGVGSHSLDVPIACEKNKVNPDFYVKTFHTDRYWSATPKEHRQEYDWMKAHSEHDANHDNMWCNNPEETAAFMETVDKPWVAFKVMAAGAINPTVGFSYAFRNGADFVVAGMFDFQVETDVKIAIDCVRKAQNRKRPWHG
ncbi:MAG: hypothetical protein ABFD16_07665 [Thermoguttaceae bacterium]